MSLVLGPKSRAAATALLVVAAGAAIGGCGKHENDAGQVPPNVKSETVERRNLIQSVAVDGTLGFGDSKSATNQVSGTVTRLPKEGTTIAPGHILYFVDEDGVVLLDGRLPAWRALGPGTTDGPDIRQLEQNLVDLGYDPNAAITVDNEWTDATTAAVKRLQKHARLEQTGSLENGRVIFMRGPRKVGEIKAKTGDAARPGMAMFTTTSTRQHVTAQISPDQALAVRVGDPVTVDLPNGDSVKGKIAKVGAVAQSGGEDGESTVNLTIALNNGRGLERLDQAPVSVHVAQQRKHKAVAVPAGALVARPGGRYGVEVASGSGYKLVEVEPGLFADGYVEVDGVEPGDKVAVPQ